MKILCCGTGIGVCTPRLTRHWPKLAKAIVDTWLASEFDPKGAAAANVDAINRLDASQDKKFPRKRDNQLLLTNDGNCPSLALVSVYSDDRLRITAREMLTA